MLFYAILMTYNFSSHFFLQSDDVYNESEAVEIHYDNTNIDKMSEMSYKIDFEIVNTSGNKKKIEEVDNQVSEVILDLVDRVEESLTQNPQQKKGYKRYKTEENRKQRDSENHPLLPGCSSTFSKQCSNNFTEKVRAQINKYCWNMSSKEMQMQWMSPVIETCTPSCPRKYTFGKKERKVTRIFFLEKKARQKIQVCQVMFLRTLGFKSDLIMRTALPKTADTRNEIINDDRGRLDPANKKSQEMEGKVVSHIKKYNPPISHYRQAHAPNRLYISPEHSISLMHKDFIAYYSDDRVS